jgi:hypothetical protein
MMRPIFFAPAVEFAFHLSVHLLTPDERGAQKGWTERKAVLTIGPDAGFQSGGMRLAKNGRAGEAKIGHGNPVSSLF